MDTGSVSEPEPLEPHEGYAELVRRWLRTFGPGTETDIVWWLGATKTAVRRALGDVGAVEVSLDDGGTGWVLADDLEPVDPEPPWAALLPVLDPTTMGWKQRDFYLDPDHTPYLFDTNGNAGSTAWWNGRIVGCWVQDEDGVVQVVLREDPGARGAGGARRRGGETDRLPRRRTRQQRLRVPADEVGTPALTGLSPVSWRRTRCRRDPPARCGRCLRRPWRGAPGRRARPGRRRRRW